MPPDNDDTGPQPTAEATLPTVHRTDVARRPRILALPDLKAEGGHLRLARRRRHTASSSSSSPLVPHCFEKRGHAIAASSGHRSWRAARHRPPIPQKQAHHRRQQGNAAIITAARFYAWNGKCYPEAEEAAFRAELVHLPGSVRGRGSTRTKRAHTSDTNRTWPGLLTSSTHSRRRASSRARFTPQPGSIMLQTSRPAISSLVRTDCCIFRASISSNTHPSSSHTMRLISRLNGMPARQSDGCGSSPSCGQRTPSVSTRFRKCSATPLRLIPVSPKRFSSLAQNAVAKGGPPDTSLAWSVSKTLSRQLLAGLGMNFGLAPLFGQPGRDHIRCAAWRSGRPACHRRASSLDNGRRRPNDRPKVPAGLDRSASDPLRRSLQ